MTPQRAILRDLMLGLIVLLLALYGAWFALTGGAA